MPSYATHSAQRTNRSLLRRVTTAAAATLLAAGTALSVAPSASAQGLPPSVQGSYESLHPYAQQAIGSTIVGSYAAVALPYLTFVCPLIHPEADRGACAF
ncbi:MAG: hypothetical protein ACTH1D_03380 [Mycobacteriaceae bacterium]|uniref:hypothetical protein n=1 Tax=Corynebacterium sp. TaxID=1720 RepID=UPI003F975568